MSQLLKAYVGLTFAAKNEGNTRTVPIKSKWTGAFQPILAGLLGAQGVRLSPILLSTVFAFLNLGGVVFAQADPQPTIGSEVDPASGPARKCYVVTRDDIRYGESPGIDAATGRECRPVTAEVIERLRAYKWGNRPRRVESTDPIFFSLRTGEPIVWYHKDEKDEIQLFDLMGFDPGTGDELVPITKEMVALWRDQEKKRKEDEGRRKKEEARQAPQLIDPEKYDPFDPLSGKPRVWYSRNEEGEYQFFDNPGFDPRTGVVLAIITRDVLSDWSKNRRKRSAQSCYIITKDSNQPVQYRESPGIDPDTGRQCRLVTPELLERLREYEKGNRPTRIQHGEPTFFDLRTGEAVVWYYKNQKGEIEIFDLMGFHPETGEELVPITKEVVALWQEHSKRRPPRQVDLKSYELFDPLTGESRVWFWRGDEGKYEFYDNDGYHPRTGERLISLTKDGRSKDRKGCGGAGEKIGRGKETTRTRGSKASGADRERSKEPYRAGGEGQERAGT